MECATCRLFPQTEADGRMFPESDTSSTIIDCLMGDARQLGGMDPIPTPSPASGPASGWG